MIELTADGEGVGFAVKAQPGSKRNAIVGEHAGALKVAVCAAPEKGKANQAIQEVLADAFGVRRADVVLLQGSTSPRKVFRVKGLSREELARRLTAILTPETIDGEVPGDTTNHQPRSSRGG